MQANRYSTRAARIWLSMVAACALGLVGCGTTRTSNTARTATEQLLISDAIDRTVSSIDFTVFRGEAVYFDEQHLKGVVDDGYLISSFRQHLLASGCLLKDKKEEATYVLEPRVGAIGTDNHDLLFGIPAVNVPQVGITTPLPAAIPEIPVAKRRDQQAVAKLAVFAYRRDTGQPVWQSGIVEHRSTANDIWVLGAGPFQRGTIYDGTRFIGKGGGDEEPEDELGPRVADIDQEAVFAGIGDPKPTVAKAKSDGAVAPASAEGATTQAAGAPVLPPAKPIAEAPAEKPVVGG